MSHEQTLKNILESLEEAKEILNQMEKTEVFIPGMCDLACSLIAATGTVRIALEEI